MAVWQIQEEVNTALKEWHRFLEPPHMLMKDDLEN